MKITLAGTGCGSLNNMTLEVRKALTEADLIIGAKRLIEGFPPEMTGERRPGIYAREILDMIMEAQEEADEEYRVCVAFSGDSGFYSGTRSLLPLLKDSGFETEVLPGISSIQVFAARLQQPWQDWKLVSAHGTDCDAIAAVMQEQPVFFLTGGKLTPAELAMQLTRAGLGNLKAFVGERLTYDDERILAGTVADFAKQFFQPLSVMLVEPAQWLGDLTPGIDDSAFLRGDVPMTKETVRAAILSQMRVRPSDIVWDVGAGTGSVSIELAMKAKAGRVFAVEREPEGCELIRKNRERFGMWNICLVDGAAPEALRDLPAPDKVFVGGSDGHMQEIIDIVLRKKPAARICVSAIVLETMQEAVSAMTAAGMDVKIVQVAVSTARRIGKDTDPKHMMMAGNPIFIIAGQRPYAEAEDILNLETKISGPAFAEEVRNPAFAGVEGVPGSTGGRDA